MEPDIRPYQANPFLWEDKNEGRRQAEITIVVVSYKLSSTRYLNRPIFLRTKLSDL